MENNVTSLEVSKRSKEAGFKVKKCQKCGNIFKEGTICPNCKSYDINVEYKADDTWYNRYASEKMTQKEAEDFFDSEVY